MHFHGHTIILTALLHSHGLSNNLKALVNPYQKKKVLLEAVKMPLQAVKMLLEAQRVLIEDIIIFLEAMCAGPGRENACRDRAGAHKVLSKFFCFASILSSFVLTQFVLFLSCKVFY
jgi:hypothetical protein